MPNKVFETTDKLIELYNSGMTQTEIAQIYGVTQAAISYRLVGAGTPIRKNSFSDKAKRNAKINHPRGKKHPGYIDLPMDKIREEYRAGASTIFLGNEYGVAAKTIGKKLKLIGEKVRSPGFGTWCIAKDGHKVQSIYELIVDDWLYRHGIEHINQPSLPFGRNSRADFLVLETYIEVMGLISSPIYKKKYKDKLSLYEKHELMVVCVFPSHFRSNLLILERFL